MKRLVIYFDGTWSLPSDKTNVDRLRQITADVDEAGVRQMKAYWNSVGTR